MTTTTTTARFKIGDRIYTTAALDQISLRDLMRFNTEAAELGISERWNDVEQIAQNVATSTPEEAENHPAKFLLIGVTIWASRRLAGENLSFSDAVDVPIRSIQFLPPTEDKAAKKAGPTKGAKKSPRQASAPDVEADTPDQ